MKANFTSSGSTATLTVDSQSFQFEASSPIPGNIHLLLGEFQGDCAYGSVLLNEISDALDASEVLGLGVPAWLSPSGLLLVDMPEHHVRPHQIQDLLRSLSGYTVLMASESPLVIQDVPRKFTTFCRKDSKGDYEYDQVYFETFGECVHNVFKYVMEWKPEQALHYEAVGELVKSGGEIQDLCDLLGASEVSTYLHLALLNSAGRRSTS